MGKPRRKSFIKAMKDKTGYSNQGKVLHEGNEGQISVWYPGQNSVCQLLCSAAMLYRISCGVVEMITFNIVKNLKIA